jgi:hypothetical protein
VIFTPPGLSTTLLLAPHKYGSVGAPGERSSGATRQRGSVTSTFSEGEIVYIS